MLAIAAGLVVAGLRLFRSGSSHDLFVDEIVYRNLGHSVHNGGFPRLTDGHLFFFHPPGFFYLAAGWERITGVPHDIVRAVYDDRLLNGVLAGITATLLVLLGRRLWSTRAGLLAAAVFAVEPYVMRQNGRVLLETAAMVWVLLGYLLLAPLVADPARRRRSQLMLTVAGGLCFGLALLTKDLTALVTVVPLAAVVVTGWGPPRRLAALAGVVACLPYVGYLAVVAGNGYLGELWATKGRGAARLTGVLQTSGFNKPGAPHLGGQLVRQLSDYGSTYALTLLGALVVLLLLRRGPRLLRFFGLFHLCAGGVLAYAVLFGTLEEQFLYLLVLPSLLTLAVGVCWALERWPLGARALPIVVGLVAAAVLASDATTYLRWHLSPDDGFARLRSYLAGHVARGSALTVVNGTAELALRDDYRVGPFTSPADRARYDVRYLVVPRKEVTQGYSYVSAPTVAKLTAGARKVFAFHGRTYGEVALYQLPPPSPGTG